MPILKVKVSQPASTDMTLAVSKTLLELTTRILHKKLGLTSIAIDYVPLSTKPSAAARWQSRTRAAFYFDIQVVDGTHTEDQKARHIAEAFTAFSKLLGKPHEESYICVHGVRAEAYGFGSLAQAYRDIEAIG